MIVSFWVNKQCKYIFACFRRVAKGAASFRGGLNLVFVSKTVLSANEGLLHQSCFVFGVFSIKRVKDYSLNYEL